MEYAVFKKDGRLDRYYSEVMEVLENDSGFSFVFGDSRSEGWNKDTYTFCKLKDVKHPKQKIDFSKEKLVDILNKFFNIEGTDDYWVYWIAGIESIIANGTVTVDAFKAFTGENINELADFIINELVK